MACERPQPKPLKEIAHDLRYEDFAGGKSLYEFISLEEAMPILAHLYPGVDYSTSRFISACQAADGFCQNIAPDITYPDPTRGRYLYEFSEGPGLASQQALGIAVDGNTMLINDGFLTHASPKEQRYQDLQATLLAQGESNAVVTIDVLEKFLTAYSYTKNLDTRIRHERIHQLTFANARFSEISTNSQAVTATNQALFATNPVEVAAFDLVNAQPLGLEYASGVLLTSYFKREGEIYTTSLGNAMNELFTNYLAQKQDDSKTPIHPFMEPIIQAVGSYTEAMRLFLGSNFAAIEALFEAKYGPGSYLSYLRQIEDFDQQTQNIQLGLSLDITTQALVQKLTKLQGQYEEILRQYPHA